MPRRHLRTRLAPPHRALDHLPESTFEVSPAEENASHDALQDRERPLKAPQLQQPKQSDAASWDTRATILLAEALAVTAIVGIILFYCLRKQRQRSTRRRVFTAQQLQEWTTIRIPAAGGGGAAIVVPPSPRRNGRRARMDSNVSGMSIVSVGRDGRIRVDSGVGGMSLGEVPARLAGANGPNNEGAASDHDNNPEEAANEERTRAQRVRDAVLFVPRTIGRALMYPLLALEAGVNDWAQENQDEIFLRQFVERLEAEREAAMESPEEREKRLKEAFLKECMVWKLNDENFLPPPTLLAVLGGDEPAPQDDEMNYGLYSLGEGAEDVLVDLEEGNMETIPEDHPQGVPMEVDEGEGGRGSGGGSCPINPVCGGEHAPPAEAAEKESIGAPRAINEEVAVADDDCESDTAGYWYWETPKTEEPTPLMMDETVNSPAATTALEQRPSAEDTFDSDAEPGFLYLSSSGRNRRRANTDSSISSANHSTLSSAESAESLGSVSASTDSHKISNECAICLCEYESGDVVVASSNSECPHAFHQECIVEWLCKMQEGTPCPCCRRTFVELDEQTPNNGPRARTSSTGANEALRATEDPEEAERRRQERRRRNIELGLRRGGRAFNASVISFRSGSMSSNDAAGTPEDSERWRQERIERLRRRIELGARRGRAFNTSVISMR